MPKSGMSQGFWKNESERICVCALSKLVALAPDVILATGSPTLGPLLEATRTVPIVFATVADPVGSGFVDSLARPGGNAKGFFTFRIQPRGEMAGATQRDRAERDARGSDS
jgi:ABC transporter substrate binding protein